MSDYPFEGLVGSHSDRRKGHEFSFDPHPPGESRPGMNAGMLIQDLAMFSLPSSRGGSNGYNVEIVSDDPRAAKLIQNAIPGHGYRGWPDWSSLQDYLRSATFSLMQGDLLLEIEYFRSPTSPDASPVAFQIDVLPNERVRRRPGRIDLLVYADRGDRMGWAPVSLNDCEVVTAKLPRSLRRNVRHALNVLQASDRSVTVLTDFTTGKHGQNSGFNFDDYQRRSNDIVLRGTRKLGWAGRSLLMNGLLDPHKAWRAIQFARFTIQVRDVALSALQEAIDRAGVEIGFTAGLELTGVLQPHDLDAMEADLAAGTRPMSELLFPEHRAED